MCWLLALTAQVAQLAKPPALNGSQNFRFSSGNPDWKTSNVDFKPILPGKTLTLADIKGPGVIRRMWLTILPSEPAYSKLMTLRIYWDGETSPSVETPLGDFFGVGHGVDKNLNSIPVRVSAEGRARCCYWAMPFRKSARVTVTNDGSRATWCFYYQVDGNYEAVPPDEPYFCAEYRQEHPCTKGRNFVVADIKGKGAYMGTVLNTHSRADGWWGEGNDYFFIDGAQTPTLAGTGMEDYFGEAWALRETTGPYDGCSLFDGGFAGARATCYRWHVPDPVRFEKSLRVEFQDMGVGQNAKGEDRNDVYREDDFSSVAFWYQTGERTPHPPLPSGYDRLVFDYRHFVDTDKLKIAAPPSGHEELVKMNGLHGSGEIEWSNGQVGDTLNLPFSVPKAGRYQVVVLISKRSDGGLGRFQIDGQNESDKLSFFDGEGVLDWEAPLYISNLSAGSHQLSLQCLGKAPEADHGRWFAIDGFIVQPIE